MNAKRFCAHFTLVAMLAATTSPYLKADGERTNVRGIGMGYTAVATSRGLDAVGINPANLAYPDVGSVTISLIPFGVHVGSDFLTLGLYNEYFTGVNTDSGRVGRYLGETDKQRILSAFPEDWASLREMLKHVYSGSHSNLKISDRLRSP